MSTFRQIIETVKRVEGYRRGNVIGIITTRGALDTIDGSFEIGGKRIKVNEYPATTIEEEIIQGVRAEKEGVKGLICGPIAATTLEKVVDIPITALRFEEGAFDQFNKKAGRENLILFWFMGKVFSSEFLFSLPFAYVLAMDVTSETSDWKYEVSFFS